MQNSFSEKAKDTLIDCPNAAGTHKNAHRIESKPPSP
jgi:hypothetical protein